MRKSLFVAPPSTLRDKGFSRESFSTATRLSRAWYAMDSSALRQICSLLLPRVRPMIIPRAYWSQ